MADLATIGFKAETSDLVNAKAKLEALVPAAGKVQKSADAVSAAFTKVGAAAAGISTGTTKASAAMAAAASATDSAKSAVDRLAAANDNLRAKYNPLYATIQKYKQGVVEIRAAHASGALTADEMTAALNRLRTASLASIAAVKGQSGAVLAAAGGMKLRTDEMLNLSRQAADVGVTLAMGMNPLMVAIQQGPQIADIFASASARGLGFRAVLGQIGAAASAALTPILIVLGPIALGIGLVASAFALGARAINADMGSVTSGMDLTSKQLAKLKKEGVDTTVTIGDTFKAFFQVAGERLAAAFAGPLKSAGDAFDFFFDNVAKGGMIVIKAIVGGFVGAIVAIRAGWSLLPAALGDLTISTANNVIRGTEIMINGAIGGINKLIAMANPTLNKVDLGIDQLANVSLDKLTNSFAGAGTKFAETTNAAFKASLSGTDAAVDRFFGDVGKRARANRRKFITEAAGDPAKTPKTPKGPKTAAGKFDDIVNGAQRDIASVRAEIAGVNLSADAALRLKNEQKLLNEAQAKGIQLTPAWRAQLIGLAGTLTTLQVRLKDMQGFKEIGENAEKNMTGLLAQRSALDKVGQSALYLQYQTSMLAEATGKKLNIDAGATKEMNRMADALARVAQANANLKYFIDARNAGSEFNANAAAELATIGMSARATSDYMFQQKLLNDEKFRGISLNSTQKQDLIDLNTKQFELNQTIDATRAGLDFARESTKGFVSDLRSNLGEGQNIFQAFGNSVLSLLGKIADKLMDIAIDAAFSGGAGAGIGGFLASIFTKSAKGNVFGASEFAKGDAFTNSIVNRPTAFAFGKGGANLGIMGEAGPEAVMPLTRGANGSLGVQMYGGAGGGAPQRVEVALKVQAEPTDMWRAKVGEIAEQKSQDAVQSGLTQYDRTLPSRVQEISMDDRVRG